MISRIVGIALLIEGALLLLPFVAGLFYGEHVWAFLITGALAALAGGGLCLLKPQTNQIFAREGFISVSLVWLLMSAFGALPFVLSGDIPSYIDAFFETVSGFTTTGASVLNNVEGLSRSCLFWRSFTHWIGGMGVLVFIMAVLPMSGEHSMHIMRAEVPGPVVGKLVPRARDTAKILYLIYGGLTALETVFLVFGGMSFFDALLHAFSTAGTGGFSTKNAGVLSFNSRYIETVLAVFLVLFGINFNLYYLILVGKVKEALKSEELHVYAGIILISVLAIAAGITGLCGGFSTALHRAFFYTMSIMSTAGFTTWDYTQWPQYTQVVIVLLMFIGGCAGSTGGGLKVSRVMLLVKNSIVEIATMISPRRVKRVRMDGKCVENGVTKTVSSFFFLYILILLLCTFVVSFDGYDFATGFTASLSCISNVGPGLSMVGPLGNFSIFSPLSKIVMSLTMLLGRLEIYPIIIMISAVFRKRK